MTATGGGDGWDPEVYRQFEAERRQPFCDLLALCQAVHGGRVVDLGCGSGERTVELHQVLLAAQTVGIDRSEAMLAEACRLVDGSASRGAAPDPGLRFETGDLARFDGPPADVIFANASLQWVPDHPAVLARLRRALLPGGQLAFQVPSNFDHLSHRLAREVASEEPFASALGLGASTEEDLVGIGPAVLKLEVYAELLHSLGATAQLVRLEVYGHQLESAEAVVDWVQGTLLSAYRSRLEPELAAAFVDRYGSRLRDGLGTQRPYCSAFPRVLAWARFP